MPANENNPQSSPLSDVSPKVEKMGKAFVAAWLGNQEERIEPYLAQIPEDMQTEAHDILIRLEVYIRASHGELPDQEEYHHRFPGYELEVEQAFRADSQSAGPVTNSHSEALGNTADFELASRLDVVPDQVGRYRIENVLGTGGFGVVCLATDTELNRQVALKFARTSRFRSRKEMDELVAEARTAAQLSHPGIVAVHDVILEGDMVAIIQQFVEGRDLAAELREGIPAFERTGELIAGVCLAIAFAHTKGFIHRDLKPANILLNDKGEPHIADFGLAIHESFQRRRRGDKSGTPRYMSPELVRGESHRIDGRSDIWSIGVMLYEMLTGHRPFAGETRAELFDEIKHRDPRPLRQINSDVPVELERICLKCLSKPVSRRYTTATDIAEDLRHWLQLVTVSPSDLDSSSGGEWEVIPRGLRSFDSEDAEFFLNLVPGPVARNGLPESIRFWKNRIEQTEQDLLQIGLLYGPSGCGKSSFIKAGLLPVLAPFIQPVRIEATAADTEVRLIKALRARYNDIPTELTLPEVFHSLREGLWTGGGDRVLVVIDQFEQWLHNRSAYPNTELVEALRHCDGHHIQCLLTVRDDFWLATSRFLKALEVDLVEGRNAALVDLFDKPHARKVLRRYGRGYGRLEEKLTRQQEEFVEMAVNELADDQRVICVRLSLFAEMFKDKAWTPAALRRIGGISGVGVAFLDETFSSRSARPEFRLHEEAARNVLAALLPDSSVDIRGNMRSRSELLRESGYANRPHAFADVIRILDNELRLITPTDPDGIHSNLETNPAISKDYYQLTHDYLVAPLRVWLNQKQQESIRGRARLRLDERHAMWSRTRENRFLPPLGEYINVRSLTRPSGWSAGERELMSRADRFYGLRMALLVGAVMLAGFFARGWYHNLRANAFVSRLTEADTSDVRSIIDEFDQAGLREAVADRLVVMDETEHRQSLNIDLALGHLPDHRRKLWERIASPESRTTARDVASITGVLQPSEQELQQLWSTLLEPPTVGGDLKRLRAAIALSAWMPDDSRWQDVSHSLAGTILDQGAYTSGKWVEAMPAIHETIMRGLIKQFRTWQYSQEGQRDPQIAVNVLQEFQEAWPGIADHLQSLIDQYNVDKGVVGPGSSRSEIETWESLSQEQANVASMLAALGHVPSITELMSTSRHEATRTLLIEQLHQFDAAPGDLIAALQQEVNTEARAALWLVLGPYVSAEIDESDALLKLAQEEYMQHPDALVHSAVEWLLIRMNRRPWILEQYSKLASNDYTGGRSWRINRQGQTLLKIPAPGAIVISHQRRARIDYEFEVAAREVTWAEFLEFYPPYSEVFDRTVAEMQQSGSAPENPHDSLQRPATYIQWYLAAEYCNWLSRQHGIPEEQWCYEELSGDTEESTYRTWGLASETTNPDEGVQRPRLQLVADYQQRTGFRLPLESEWDLIAWPHGMAERQTNTQSRVTPRYEWFAVNHSGDYRVRVFGQKKPGRFGTFDVYGNVQEFCSDFYTTDLIANDRTRIPLEPGGIYVEPVTFLKTHEASDRFDGSMLARGIPIIRRDVINNRSRTLPDDQDKYTGFRVVRMLKNE